jgi:hypothetical protein
MKTGGATGNRTPISGETVRYPAVGRRHRNALSHSRTFAPSHSRTSALAVQHGGRDSNPQPPVLETGALPIETTAVCVHQASAGSRTPGLVLTMDALCRLSYGSVRFARERSGPFCRAAPPPTGVACHVVGAGAGRPARPSPLVNRSREPMTRVVKHAGPRGPAGAAHAGRPFHRKRRDCRGEAPKREAPRLPRAGGGALSKAPGRVRAAYPRNGPPPASCA